jgi:hypothetical protein
VGEGQNNLTSTSHTHRLGTHPIYKTTKSIVSVSGSHHQKHRIWMEQRAHSRGRKRVHGGEDKSYVHLIYPRHILRDCWQTPLLNSLSHFPSHAVYRRSVHLPSMSDVIHRGKDNHGPVHEASPVHTDRRNRYNRRKERKYGYRKQKAESGDIDGHTKPTQ